MYILVDVEARTCRSRGAHIACTRTYSGQGARKKIWSCMCTYRWGLECLVAHMYGEGSCSWGGNGMCRVHGEATECVVFMGRQGNASCSWGGNEMGGSQPSWTEQAMETRPGVPQNGGNGPPTVEMGVLLIGRGVAYRKTDETDLLRSKRGSFYVAAIGF